MSDMRGVMARLERRLGAMADEPRPLQGGITNRNYRVTFGARECVVRFPGKDTELLGINREAERVASARAAELGLSPALVAWEEECSVTEYVAGGVAGAETIAARLDPLAHGLRAFHDSGAQLPVRFWVPELLEAYAGVVYSRDGGLPAAYDRARAIVARIARALPLEDPVACHNDLLPANVLLAGDGRLLLLDWEYAGMGHRLFDLGNLSVNAELAPETEARLLAAYLGRAPDEAERAALRLMRVVSDAREAAWGVVQSAVSELEFDFADYATRHFERLEAAVAAETFEVDLKLAQAGAPGAGAVSVG